MTRKRTKKSNSIENEDTLNKPKLKYSISPKSENQTDYLREIVEKDVVLTKGPSGSGKTMLATYIACSHLLEGKKNRILLTRPMVQTGKGLGYLPGDVLEKTFDYMIPLYEYVELFLGKELAKEYLDREIIKICPLELMRGRTFIDTFMILDEAQNATYEQIKMFLTRIGHGSKCVLNGDIKQTDLQNSDFETIINKLESLNQIGTINFNHDDIFRSQIIKDILSRLE